MKGGEIIEEDKKYSCRIDTGIIWGVLGSTTAFFGIFGIVEMIKRNIRDAMYIGIIGGFFIITLSLYFYYSQKNSLTLTTTGMKVASITKNFFAHWGDIERVERGMLNMNVVVRTWEGTFYIPVGIRKEPIEVIPSGSKYVIRELKELLDCFKEGAKNAKFILIDEMLKDLGWKKEQWDT